ncbi:MAG TPA: Uma2 family endonuclease [Longimicrobium sp.]|nr:Uma2 family endonuclease [Longimicrobium sp.]
MVPLAQPVYTADEYLRLERAAGHRSEFVNGRIYAMTGASFAHSTILFNLAREIGAQIRGRGCRAFLNEMRVKINLYGSYLYPDFVALCEAPRFEDGVFDTLLNPSVIVEVLSDSTESYDRGLKFQHYRRIESLREYILVGQHQPIVERFVRNGDLWTLVDELHDLDKSISLESIGCEVLLADLYEQVEFPPEGERER